MNAGLESLVPLHTDVRLNLRQAATKVVALLLGDGLAVANCLSEASVHRAKRSRFWMASFTGPAGGQVWRSTGLTDRDQALLVARHWEAEARQQRAKSGAAVPKPVYRVRPSEHGAGLLTQKEVAQLLNISERAVREIERRALHKLRNHPLLRQIWQQFLRGELEEEQGFLTPAEVEALVGLCRTAGEYGLVDKVLRLIQT